MVVHSLANLSKTSLHSSPRWHICSILSCPPCLAGHRKKARSSTLCNEHLTQRKLTHPYGVEYSVQAVHCCPHFSPWHLGCSRQHLDFRMLQTTERQGSVLTYLLIPRIYTKLQRPSSLYFIYPKGCAGKTHAFSMCTQLGGDRGANLPSWGHSPISMNTDLIWLDRKVS